MNAQLGSPPYKCTYSSTTVNQGAKVDIISHSVVIYIEIPGTTEMESLLLTSLDTRARKRD